MKNILPIAICAILISAILCIVGVVTHTENEEQRKREELSDTLYLEELEKLKNERKEYEKEQQQTKEKLKNYTVYQRFADGSFDIKIGDRIIGQLRHGAPSLLLFFDSIIQ